MQISTQSQNLNTLNSVATSLAKDGKEGISKLQEAVSELDGKSISQAYLVQFSMQAAQNSSGGFAVQMGLSQFSFTGEFMRGGDGLGALIDQNLSLTGYSGKPLSQLSASEASALISDGGFFSIDNTASRIADFVIMGAGDDVERLKAGIEGVQRGFSEAQKLWGAKLPDISQKTMDQTMQRLNERLSQLGADALNMTI